MGCDIGMVGESVPYCKPRCVKFKLMVWLDRVAAQCVICSLYHEFTVQDGQILIEYKEKAKPK